MNKWQEYKRIVRQLFDAGQLPIEGVCYEDIDRSHVLIPLGEPVDISQGTGNVLACYDYDVNLGKVLAWADC